MRDKKASHPAPEDAPQASRALRHAIFLFEILFVLLFLTGVALALTDSSQSEKTQNKRMVQTLQSAYQAAQASSLTHGGKYISAHFSATDLAQEIEQQIPKVGPVVVVGRGGEVPTGQVALITSSLTPDHLQLAIYTSKTHYCILSGQPKKAAQHLCHEN